jgi:hypothetical protein
MRYNSTSATAALIAAAVLLASGTSEADDRFVHICKMNINQIFGAKVREYYPPEFSIISEVHPDTGLWFLNDRPMIIDRQDTKDETRRTYFVSFSKFLPALYLAGLTESGEKLTTAQEEQVMSQKMPEYLTMLAGRERFAAINIDTGTLGFADIDSVKREFSNSVEIKCDPQ